MKMTLPVPTLRASVLALMIVGLTACSTTTLEKTWTAPEATNLHYSKILVFAAVADPKVSKAAEDAMKAQIKGGATAVTSYELMPNVADMKDNDKVNADIKATGVDGIITMRMVSKRSKTTTTTATTRRSSITPAAGRWPRMTPPAPPLDMAQAMTATRDTTP